MLKDTYAYLKAVLFFNNKTNSCFCLFLYLFIYSLPMVNYIYVKGKGNLCVELAEYIHLLDGIDV